MPGLALFAVSGAHAAQMAGVSPMIARGMGVVTATFGGMMRDLLNGASLVVLSKAIHVTPAPAGASAYLGLAATGLSGTLALVVRFGVAVVRRGQGPYYKLALPRY